MYSLKHFFKVGFSAFALVSLLNVTSCNSGSKDDTIPEETTAPVSATAETPASMSTVDSASAAKNLTAAESNSKAETHVVTIENMKFNPATITVNKGDNVTFINKDIVAHNATEVQNTWASPMLQTGQSWTFNPEKTADYYCTVHVVMKGKIIVK